MIDFANLIILDLNASVLEVNPLLNFEQRNITDEGFLFPILDKNNNHLKDKKGKLLFKTPYKIAFYKGLKFKIYSTGVIILSGSLHKYWNNGMYNYNDFNLKAVLWVLRDLKEKFKIEPDRCVLKCLEIGVNITPPIPTNDILDYCLLHKTKSLEDNMDSRRGKFKRVEHSQYTIKIYNKALHCKSKGFKIKDQIMRFEIKYSKMQKLNMKGIFSLQDLVNYGLENFKSDLLNEWQNVLFYDKTTRIDALSTKIKNALLKYSNKTYWTELLDNNQNENFKYHKKQLKKIIAANSDNIQSLTADIISKKIDLLNSIPTRIDSLTIQSKRIVLNHTNSTYERICSITSSNIR